MSMWTTLIPTAFNTAMQLQMNEQNTENYFKAQQLANQFAREERIAAQNYNSLENQFAQMQRVGMNPNLLQGQDFLSTSPVSNQSVNPPQGIAPQMPVDSLSQSKLANSQSRNIDAQTITEDLFRNLRYKLGESEIMLNWSNTDVAKESRLKLAQERLNLGRSFYNLLLEANEIVSRTKVNQASASSLAAQTEGQRISNSYAPMLSKATYNKIVSDSVANYANAALMRANSLQIQEFTRGLRLDNRFKFQTYGDRLRLFKVGLEKERIGVEIMRTNNGMLKFQFGQMKTYDDWQKSLGIALDVVNVIKGIQDVHPLNPKNNWGLKYFDSMTGPIGDTFGQ